MSGWSTDFGDGVIMECDHLRRERGELYGQLTVWCSWAEARTYTDIMDRRNGNGGESSLLSKGDFNFSGLRSRQDRAAHLEKRATSKGKKLDWYSRVERFCFETLEKETRGIPAISIWDVAETAKEVDDFAIDGVALPRRLPAIIFGDGASMKSYYCLYLSGKLSLQGVRVAYFDWELDAEDHKKRFSLLFGSCRLRPDLIYCHCDLPLNRDSDRAAKVIRDYKIQYAIFDSLSCAVDQRAEEHETCLHYFSAVRQFGIGSLHVAHMNKSETGDQKPFGSVFWYNLARSVWYAKATPLSEDRWQMQLHHRKANCGPRRPPVGFQIQFTDQATVFQRVAIEDTATEVRDTRPAWVRIRDLIQKRGPMIYVDIAETLDDLSPKTIRKAVERKANIFNIVRGGTGETDRVDLLLSTSDTTR